MTPKDTEAAVRAYAAEHIPSLMPPPADPQTGLTPTSNIQHPTSPRPPTDPRTPTAPPPTSRRLILAVSGGADSIALAAILCEAGIIDTATVVVAHFDHRLRGDAAAARDRAVVEALCERYGLRLVIGAWGAPLRSEAAARGARYRFLANVALDCGAAAVATGHTEDDQVETVVLNTLRGSGAYGQAGMLPERPWPHAGDARVRALRLVRPLLAVTREATRAYCAARGLAFADDPTNDDPAFARNRVRAMLADVDAETPDARDLILRTAALARGSLTTLEAAAAKAVRMWDAEDGRAIALDRAPLRTLPAELSGYAWHRAVERLLGDTRDFGRPHFATMHAAANARTGAVFELPRGVVLTVDPEALLISVGTLADPAVPPEAAHGAPFAGVLGAWYVELTPAASTDVSPEILGEPNDSDPRTRLSAHPRLLDRPETYPSEPGASAWSGELRLELAPGAVLRGRRPGDRIALPGGRGHRKLHDAYIDAKVPHRRRDGAPVLADGRDVLWTPLLPAVAAAAGAKVDIEAVGRFRVRWRGA